MRVLVTGGYGVLGYHICCRLAELGHEIAIVDYLQGWEFGEGIPSEDIDIPNVSDYFNDNFMQAMVRFKPERVIHCAEHNGPDISMAHSMAHTNIGFTTQVVHMCASQGIRCVVPAWSEYRKNAGSTFLGQTLKWRSKITNHFNIGNGVNSTVFMPRIISPYEDIQFGTVVNRVYRTLLDGKLVHFYEDEIGSSFNEFAVWCSADHAAEKIVDVTLRRTRNNITIQGEMERIQLLVAYVAMRCTGKAFVEVMVSGRMESFNVNVDLTYFETHKQFNPQIKQLIDEVLDVWER